MKAKVTPAELHRALRDWGFPLRAVAGANHDIVELPGGSEIRVPRADAHREPVSPRVIAAIARSLGVTAREVVEQILGHVTVPAGRPAGKVAAPEAAGPSRAEVAAQAETLRRRAGQVERWARQGTHDRAVYRRALTAIEGALRELAGWPPAPDMDADTAARLAPDDAGYQPARPDPLRSGAGPRATGVAATAVARGKTYTAWEHTERTEGER